jgi:hypothetical protein
LTDGNRTLGELHKRRDVGTQEVLAVTQTDDEGRVAASANNNSRGIFVHDEQSESTVEARNNLAKCLSEVTGFSVCVTDEERRYFRVCFAREGVSIGEELLLELVKVFDNAVVDERQAAVVSQLRVRILIVGATVGRPPRVPDSGGAVRYGVLGQIVYEHLELARFFTRTQPTRFINYGNAC